MVSSSSHGIAAVVAANVSSVWNDTIVASNNDNTMTGSEADLGGGGNETPLIQVGAGDDGLGGGENDSHDAEITVGTEADFDPTIMIIAFGIVVGLWCFAVCLTTKGCRDCEYKISGGDYDDDDDGVWAVVSREQRDAVLARQLQIREDALAIQAAAASPEDWERARQEWHEKAKLRSEYLDTILPAVGMTDEISLPLQQQQQAANSDDDDDNEDDGERDPENNHNEKWRCTVCLSSKVGGQKEDTPNEYWVVRSTSGHCEHCFHRGCIAGWLLSNTKCPICRQCFLKEDYCMAEPSSSQQQQQEEGKVADFVISKDYVPPVVIMEAPPNEDDNLDIMNPAMIATNTTTMTTTITSATILGGTVPENSNSNSNSNSVEGIHIGGNDPTGRRQRRGNESNSGSVGVGTNMMMMTTNDASDNNDNNPSSRILAPNNQDNVGRSIFGARTTAWQL